MPTIPFTLPLQRLDGSIDTLASYAGRVMLIVNVASKCGLTPQYEGLEKLHRVYRERGLVVLGFPANDFAGQEPGGNAEIGDFCRSVYGVDFPMFAKIAVKGPSKHPLYKALVAGQPHATFKPGSTLKQHLPAIESRDGGDEIAWNFEKFLIGRDGSVVARFAPDIEPGDEMVVRAIEKALAA